MVVAGQAGFVTTGDSLVITNSPGAIINWQSFSINAGESTRFVQSGPTSSVLNRVIGADPSVILGTLTSNGRVFLINPGGILFGQGARIDVAGLVASTLNLSNHDFLAGRLDFVGDTLAGKVENRGSITTPSGGSVYLVGAGVANSGIISSPQGDVILAAGQSVKIFDSSTPGVRVELTASDNAAINLGEILAQSGEVGIYGATLRNAGIINADQVVQDASGKIVLRAKRDVTLAAGGRISASGEQGGVITIQSETGVTLASGTVEAKGTGTPASTGGTVQLLGNRVGLIGTDVDVSGTAGGGSVLVGGDYQGGNSSVQNAAATYVSADATIKADALDSGDGGKVIVWADDVNRYYGNISARGGVQQGDGGFAEVSGKNNLVFDGHVDLRASGGRTGTLLLDPLNLTIQAAAPDVNGDTVAGDDLNAALNTPNIFFADYAGNNSVITTGQVVTQLNTADVTLQATNNITVAAAIDASGNAVGKALTLQAGNDVIINAAITTASVGGGSLILSAGHDVTVGAALTATGGSVSLLADNDGTGPGLAGGTVTFGAVTAESLTIRFNPVDYTTTSAEIAAYAPKATLSGAAIFDARAWTFIDNASATAQNKIYNANTVALLDTPFTFLGGPDGVTAGQIVSLSAGAANFNSKDVLTANAVNFTGYGLGGADLGSYALFSQPATQAATITAKALTQSGLTVAASKIYDATTSTTLIGAAALQAAEAPGAGTTADGKAYTGDTVSLGGTSVGTYNSKDVATASTVTFSGLTLGGAQAGNYTLTPHATQAATITAKALTQSGLSVAASKIYDATTGTTLIGAAALQAAEAPGTGTTADGKSYTGDAVSLAGTAVGTYNSKDVATASTVSFSGLTLGGAQAGNYTLTPHATQAATITAKALTVAADAQNKIYGTDDPALTFSVAGLVNNPALGISESAASVFAGALTRASGETVLGGPYAIAQGTLAANSNYTLSSFVGSDLSITPAPLNVAAHLQSKLFGTSDPALTFSVAGLANNPALGIADTAGAMLSGALARASGESALGGPYAITQGTLVANSNYSLSFMNSNLVIVGAAAEPVLGFNAGQVVFAGVINNDFYYRPGNFWHISLNSNNADPGFDVMRGTNDSGSRLSKRMNSCDSVSGGGFCETWSFPQQRGKVDKK
ncbi:MAG: YDG domain-containing protein [Gallionella sp.]|nr:YDG domain-containing protein [Gallionella sp.]